MASLKRDRAGNYICRFWTNGRGSRLVYENFGPISHKDARERAKALISKSEDSKTLADPNITFERLVSLWTEIHATPNLKPRTFICTESVLRLHLLPAFDAKRVRDLLPVHVERHRAERMTGENAPTPATMNLEMALFKQVLAWGAAKKIVPNPLPRGSVTSLPVTEKTVYFEPKEWRAFIAAAEADPLLAVAAPAWRLQLLTASRVGEMAALTWAGVDFTRKVLTIFMPKVDRPKTLRLSPEMERVLSGLTRGIGEAPVFIDAKGPLRTRRLQGLFTRTLRAAGLEAGGAHGQLTTHSIRHTAATWARKAGVPLDRISGILGHKDLTMVLRYAHIEPEDLDGALAAVEIAAGAAVNER